jgi:hypothetical protein
MSFDLHSIHQRAMSEGADTATAPCSPDEPIVAISEPIVAISEPIQGNCIDITAETATLQALMGLSQYQQSPGSEIFGEYAQVPLESILPSPLAWQESPDVKPNSVAEEQENSQIAAEQQSAAEIEAEQSLIPMVGDNKDSHTSALSPSELRAVQKYGESNNLAISDVTLGMVMDSNEGILHWATVGYDFGTRTPEGQCFKRALNQSSDALAMYQTLTDDLKMEFRQWWSVKRTWEFTKQRKIISTTHKKSTSELGEYRTRSQIAMELGAGLYTAGTLESQEVFQQADRYMSAAREIGGAFVTTNSWLGCEQVLFIKKLTETTTTKEWHQIAESSSTVNIWEEKAKESRARRALAASKGLHVDKVSLEDVLQTPEGVEGWERAVMTLPGTAKPKCKAAAAKAKCKASQAPTDGSTTPALAERQVKDVMAKEVNLLVAVHLYI